MGREILFRGKRKDNGEWIEGGYAEHDGKVFIVTWVKYVPDTRDWDTVEYYENNPHYKSALIEVIPETVCQYTGLTDKNGRKIFEGDLIQKRVNVYKIGETAPCGERMLTGNVIWDDSYLLYPGHWSLESKDKHGNNATYIFDNEYKVIGNIFDNLELLNQ